MRTSVFSRSVVAIASLAIGSVALTAAPASATLEISTRDLVRAVAQAPATVDITNDERRLVWQVCDFEEHGSDEIREVHSAPFVTDNAEGVLLTAHLYEPSANDSTVSRWCSFAALATTDEAFTLSGTASMTLTVDEMIRRASDPTPRTYDSTLAGNLFVTEPVNFDSNSLMMAASLTTSGHATRSANVTTTEKITAPKVYTPAVKKAKKAKYDKRLQAAKKWYVKALKKAGTKSKKTAVKKAYAKKKAAYLKAYKKVYYTTKTVTQTKTQTENRPFATTVGYVWNWV